VLFTLFDYGAGRIEVNVWNGLPYAVDAFMSWSWGGVNGQFARSLTAQDNASFRTDLPPGFDATIEIGAKKI
jgi:hypothetical protein